MTLRDVRASIDDVDKSIVALPGKVVTVARAAEGVLVASGGESAEIDEEAASHLFVRRL